MNCAGALQELGAASSSLRFMQGQLQQSRSANSFQVSSPCFQSCPPSHVPEVPVTSPASRQR
eukprot:17071-Rhodomonas_salina.1